MNTRSALNREATLSKLGNETFDLAVIGGGITGAGIALDAASRGMKVALVEQKDFANGTSSKSTKLIHGGLRYLKNLEIGLVREVGHERAVVHKIAPHMVIPQKMLLPFYNNGTFGPKTTSLALWAYDHLAKVDDQDRRKMLTRQQTLDKEPLLKQDGLKGSGYYAEYRADDARLTIENIKSAVDHGAICLNYVSAEKFLYGPNENISGILCRDVLEDVPFELKATYVVNATGPWTDILRKKDDGSAHDKLFLSKGVHIVIAKEKLPLRQAVYFDVPDGRMIFAIAHHRATYIGTTDTKYTGDIDEVRVTREDALYLLDATNNMFPGLDLKIGDIESAWAGLRPLIFKEGKSAGELSRKDEIFISKNDLITITGGKLTGYRKMAEEVVDLVARRFEQDHQKTFRQVKTKDIVLNGGPFNEQLTLEDYKKTLTERLKAVGLEGHWPEYMLENYGRQSDAILEKIPYYDRNTPEEALIRGEVWFAIIHELAHTPIDFFGHRTGRLFYDLPGIEAVKNIALEDFETYFDWEEDELKNATLELDRAIQSMTDFGEKDL